MSITFPRFTERTFDVILRGSAGEQGEGDQELAHEEVGKEKEPATNPNGITTTGANGSAQHTQTRPGCSIWIGRAD